MPELMTVGDFLGHFRIGRTSFYREVGEGRLRIVKVGRATRVARTDAAAWLNKLREQQDGPFISSTEGDRT